MPGVGLDIWEENLSNEGLVTPPSRSDPHMRPVGPGAAVQFASDGAQRPPPGGGRGSPASYAAGSLPAGYGPPPQQSQQQPLGPPPRSFAPRGPPQQQVTPAPQMPYPPAAYYPPPMMAPPAPPVMRDPSLAAVMCLELPGWINVAIGLSTLFLGLILFLLLRIYSLIGPSQ